MKPEPTTNPATTGTTVEYQVKFATGPKGRKRVRAASEAVPVPKAVPPPVAQPPRPAAPVPLAPQVAATQAPVVSTPGSTEHVPKITLLLVLGHYFERLVRDGVVRDYAEIARRTGLTRARVTQIVNLTLLAPEIQEEILAQPHRTHAEYEVCERTLRRIVALTDWDKQMHIGLGSISPTNYNQPRR